MGKNKKTKQDGDGKHSPNTVFVSNLPYTFTQPQLEEAFSEVGPIRRCFMVTNKGSNEHRGYGFVQFAVTEDASRAVELKNGSSIGGRKVRVKSAMQRVPLEQRRPKKNQEVQSDGITEAKNEEDGNSSEDVPKSKAVKTKNEEDGISSDDVPKSEAVKTKNEEDGISSEDVPKSEAVKTKNKEDGISSEAVKAADVPKSQESGESAKPKKKPAPVKDVKDDGSGSEKQRVARTVIFGGLVNAKMAENVHLIAKECGTVLAEVYPLPKGELEHHGLSKEGCKADASSVLFTSVKSARACVATLHQRKINGGFVWARQLGGEGSKTQKWKLIIRNLPFEATINDIKNLFSKVAFVWDVFVPHNPETGLAKGFAFVKFTSKQDAENAIKKFNGEKVGKRTVAVDWAVPKKLYVSGALSTAPDDDGEEAEGDPEDDSDNDDMEIESADKKEKMLVDPISEGAGMMDKEDTSADVDFDKEAVVARKVLQNLISSSTKENSVSLHDDAIDPTRKPSDKSADVAETLNPGKSGNTKLTKSEGTEGEEELQRTIFINNLPFDVDREEVKQRFSAFGEVQSFVPVLHQVTKRPRGTGFLKFKAVEAVDAAYLAANSAPGLGIILKGRQLKVFRALDKKTALSKEQEKAKKEVHDHRNLYLAKEGLIVEGTPAAEGVSASDMLKRQELHKKKETKLKSPNFHVSRTRLIMYNLPKSMKEKELQKLCIDAVTSRATKQKPVIRQVKFLKDVKNGKPVENNYSRGVAFLEFTEHEHALVALRVLNNNPEVFGSEHRPIVEFALDNVQTLKLRENRIQQLQEGSHGGGGGEEKIHQIYDKNAPDTQRNKRLKKHKTKGDDVSHNGRKTSQEDVVEKKVPEGNKNQFPPGRTKKNDRGEGKFKDRKSVQAPKMGIDSMKSGSKEKDRQGQKRKFQDRNENDMEGIGSKRGRKSKKNKEGGDVVDKLDMLIEKYRNKFSQNSSDKNDGQNQGSKQLKRWFES